MKSSRKLFTIITFLDEKVFFTDRVSSRKVDKSQTFNLITQSLMIQEHISVQIIGQKHFFLQNFANGPNFLRRNDLHPFLEALPLPKHDEEIVSANLIESLDLFKPLLHRDELSRF